MLCFIIDGTHEVIKAILITPMNDVYVIPIICYFRNNEARWIYELLPIAAVLIFMSSVTTVFIVDLFYVMGVGYNIEQLLELKILRCQCLQPEDVHEYFIIILFVGHMA